MEEYDVTIAIINYNTKDLLDVCLKSIEKAHPLVHYHIVVVDNASTDGSADYIHNNYPHVHLISNAGNLGFSAAANQALRTSRARYVFLLNTDTEVDMEAIDILTEFADDHADAAVVGPVLLNSDGSVQMSGRRFPSFVDATMHAFLGHFRPENKFTVRYKMTDWDRTEPRTVDWVSGAAMFTRRKAAEQINYFDERFFMYVEDLDICYRFWRAGYKVYFCPEARVLHHIAKSSEKSSARMIIEFQRSLYRFYAKTYSHTWKSLLKPLVAVGLAIRAGTLLVQDKFVRMRGRRSGASKEGSED